MNCLTHFVCGASLCIPLAGSGSHGLRYCSCTRGGTYRESRKSLPEPPISLLASFQLRGTLRNICTYVCVPCQRTRDARAEEAAGTGAAELSVEQSSLWLEQGHGHSSFPGSCLPTAPDPAGGSLMDGDSDTLSAPGGTNLVWVQDREIAGGYLAILTVFSVKQML